MPLLKITTNVPRSQVPADFISEASVVFQKAIQKPMQYVAVVVIPDSLVAFDNNQEPAAYVEIMSIGHLGEKENVIISEAVFQLLGKLGIKDTRAYVCFNDKPAFEVGYKGTTFGEIFKA